MSKYLLDKFLYTVDRDPDLVERYRSDPAGTVDWWEREIANSILNCHDYLIPDVYLFVTPIIFLLFTLEDVLRIRDYGDDFLCKYRDTSRNFLFISVIISLSYLAEIYATRFQSFGSLAFYRDLIFASISLILVIIYMVMRWRQFNLNVTHT